MAEINIEYELYRDHQGREDNGILKLKIHKKNKQDNLVEQMAPIWIDIDKLWKRFKHSKSYSKYGAFEKSVLGSWGDRSLEYRVLDATCGMGSDALILAFWGATVTCTERNPIISELMSDALKRCEEMDVDPKLKELLQKRFKFIPNKDAKEVLENIAVGKLPHTIYIDPMFPDHGKRKALPLKEMQIFRVIVGNDDDIVDLFNLALRKSLNRVVVKRPDKGTAISDLITASFRGKMVRYDMYTTKGR